MFRRFFICVAIATLCGCGQSSPQYKTYVQLDPSTEPGKVFILALVSPIDENDKTDLGTANFVLAPGQSDSVIVGNRLLPDRGYEFNVSVEHGSSGGLLVEVQLTVRADDQVLYRSKHVTRGWKAF